MIGRKKGSTTLTALELQCMQVLWNRGPSTVSEVQEGLRPAKDLAYTTVQTVLNTLQRKKRARRKLSGRAYFYEAQTSREGVLKQAVRELADQMFGGSPEDLVMSLIKSRQVDAARISRLSRKIADEDAKNA